MKGNHREGRNPPRLPGHPGDLLVRQLVHHPQHLQDRHLARRRVLGVPPVLHRQAEDHGCRRSGGPVREALRQARARHLLATLTAPGACLHGTLPGAVLVPPPVTSGPDEDERNPMSHEADGSSTLAQVLAEYADTEAALADPAVHADQNAARRLGRRFAQLAPVVGAAKELEAVRADAQAARELAAEDESFQAEADELAARIPELETRLRELLVPKDPNDIKDVILEIKAGEGGDESALFAGDLLRMYLRYAERQGWQVEMLDDEATDLGGHKSVTVAIRSRSTENPVYARLKYEGGVHRVQRVPVTESQGRIHTSAAGVLVFPEAEEVEVEIDMNDLRIDVYRSSGPGGQSVNTTDSAVRITHVPTGVVVSMQNEKSQLQNKEAAMRVLRSRLLALALEEQAAKDSAARGAQIRTVDRSEKIRTYNWPDNRIADHRSGYKANNL